MLAQRHEVGEEVDDERGVEEDGAHDEAGGQLEARPIPENEGVNFPCSATQPKDEVVERLLQISWLL